MTTAPAFLIKLLEVALKGFIGFKTISHDNLSQEETSLRRSDEPLLRSAERVFFMIVGNNLKAEFMRKLEYRPDQLILERSFPRQFDVPVELKSTTLTNTT